MKIPTIQTRSKPNLDETFTRVFAIEKGSIDEKARTVEVSASSELPYRRWYGFEILDHAPKSVDMSRLNDGAALLHNHKTDEQIGVVEKSWLDGKKLRSIVRFSKSVKGDEIFRDVIDGIRRNLSIGYSIDEMVLESSDKKTGVETYRVTRWLPFELSIVSVPADPTVGVGRSTENFDPRKNHLTTPIEGKMSMNPKLRAMLETLGLAREATEEQAQEFLAKPETQRAMGENLTRSMGTPAPAPQPAPAPAVTIVADHAGQERSRVTDILAIGDQFGLGDASRAAVNSGASVEQFRETVLAELKARKIITPVSRQDANIGMSPKDISQFGFVRLIDAMANPTSAAAQKNAAFELDCCRAAADQRRVSPKGALVPFDVLRSKIREEIRAFAVSGTGSNVVDTSLLVGSFIETLENAMVVKQLGVTVFNGLVGDIAIPKKTSGCTAYWIATENDAITAVSTPVLGQVTMSPKTVGAYTDISRKLIKQASIDVEMFVRSEIALRLALAMDLAALNGSNSNGQPKGILQTSGIGSVAWSTANTPSFAKVVDVETAVSKDNALLGSLAYACNATFAGKLKQTEVSDGYPIFILSNGQMNGYPTKVTNQLPTSTVIFGNWADLIVGFWGGLDITVDTSTGSTAGTVRVVGFQDCDVAVRHAESFAKGINPST